MNKKTFIKTAIKNGYTGNECKGWDWIRNNLSELDYIFQAEKYKECKGMKYKCMPFLVEDDDLSQSETRVLETAWYLNNNRVHEQEKKEKIAKFNLEGFFIIENDKALHGRKIEFILDTTDELFGGLTKLKGKLYWSETDNALMAMKTRSKRRGYWIDNGNIYIKLLN